MQKQRTWQKKVDRIQEGKTEHTLEAGQNHLTQVQGLQIYIGEAHNQLGQTNQGYVANS